VISAGQDTGLEWDSFLRATALGQFQQTTGWGRAKESERWRPHRVHLLSGECLMGGFSLFWRPARLGNIGYVSKGPVLENETDESARFAVAALKRATRRLRLRGLIVQAPDHSGLLDSALAREGFIPDRFSRVVDATLLLDLPATFAEVERGFSKSTRRHLRQARDRGTSIETGQEADLPKFFELLATTCARRRVRPNPSSVDRLRDLWRTFAKSGQTRLAFARCEGELVAATLTLGFGKTATLWKIGWTGTHAAWHPNELLTEAELRWALENGYRCCDFGAMDRRSAEQLLAHGDPGPAGVDGRYRFLLQFGGKPKLLPPARFYSPNRAVRWLHTLASRVGADRFISPSRYTDN
jgi:hypothetical protein